MSTDAATEIQPGLIRGGYHIKTLPDGQCIDVLRMMYNWRLVLSTPEHEGIIHGWCYYGHGVDDAGCERTMDSAYLAAMVAAHAWDGQGAPPGYDKQAF